MYLANYHFRFSLYTFCILILIGLGSSITHATPDDRGAMGGLVALGIGGNLAFATDIDGQSTEMSSGFANHLTFGEEVWPNLFLGLNFAFNQGETLESTPKTASLFLFGLDTRYRFTGTSKKRPAGFLLLAGIGLGAGGVVANDTQSPKENVGVSGGSVWKVGVGYEIPFTTKGRGFTLTPMVNFYHLRQQMDSLISMQLLNMGIEFMWSAGRQNKVSQRTRTKVTKSKK
jgi:hypothetical protein